MATQAEINAHDNLITGLADELAAGLEGIVSSALVGLASIDISDRIAINELFVTTRDFVNSQIQGLDSLALDNLRMNGVEPNSEIQDSVVALKTATASQMSIAIDEEVNSIAGELVTAGLLGLGIAQVIRAVSDRLPAIVQRLRRAYDQTLITFTSVLTKNLGGARYLYTGGLIPSSRPFCTTHNGAVYTQQEIDSIWNGSWQGKAPGDPFVVRGGYNCRHFFILEK